ncbi:hypothetical protein CEXT_585121 [Caerostris extrusa]|uniref:Uncharacterized protein n=1 Tax=Caerostris extrusa TaxID=172846 RepID=A0AAV4QF52_CAEEX|nr:hypothetical protein CEXT_585121 [Caerostris extrusa]
MLSLTSRMTEECRHPDVIFGIIHFHIPLSRWAVQAQSGLFQSTLKLLHICHCSGKTMMSEIPNIEHDWPKRKVAFGI